MVVVNEVSKFISKQKCQISNLDIFSSYLGQPLLQGCKCDVIFICTPFTDFAIIHIKIVMCDSLN